MKAQIHFRDALAWIAKAPPISLIPEMRVFEPRNEAVVIRFPVERIGKRG